MRLILPFTFLLFCVMPISAQSTINIQISHLLDGEAYENNIRSTNDLENDFMLDRLEYYLSGFAIKHDGGQITQIEDLYVLVSLIEKTTPTMIELGEMDIENIEAVSFYLGIDEETNHSDPSQWPIFHPLAPKFPSMHWGWAAGYRFIALEGMSGPNLDQELQFHCIGDEFYQKIEFPVTMTGSNEYQVDIDAEYTGLLKGIDVSSGMILHGNLGEIKTLASNIQEHVFTLKTTTATEEQNDVKTFNIYPNPSINGIVNFKIDTQSEDSKLVIVDMMGRIVFNGPIDQIKTVQIEHSGIYIANLSTVYGENIGARKFIVD